jgi:hypothetical protein
MRFISQFTTGYGDYTQEREELFAGMTKEKWTTPRSKKN